VEREDCFTNDCYFLVKGNISKGGNQLVCCYFYHHVSPFIRPNFFLGEKVSLVKYQLARIFWIIEAKKVGNEIARGK